MPSAARQASRTSSGKVVPFFFRLAKPISCVSNRRSSLSFLLSTSRTASVAAQMSGPMPSPGRTPILEAKALLRVLPKDPAPRGFVGRPFAEQLEKPLAGHLVGERKVRIVAAPDRAPRRRRDERAGERYRILELGVAREAVDPGELDPARRMARMKIEELAKPRLLHAVLRGKHPEVRDRERRS